VKTRRITLACWLFLWCVPLVGWAEYSEGVEYIEVVPQPVETGAKVEVREFFWYGCPHCFHLEPVLNGWRKTLSPKAKFVRTPAIFRDNWEQHARAYYAFEALGVADKLGVAMFSAIHEKNRPLDDEKSITAFAVEQGVEEQRFQDAYRSFGMANSLKHGVDLQKRYGITSVPTLVVDGKYITSPALTHGQEELTKVLDFLIDKAAKERKKRPSPR
jgi:protein dithiol oxidoreductase (disulfide-forming)